jgi:hypothetical protein
MARTVHAAYVVHIDMIRAAAMLLPLGLGIWIPLPETAWIVPFIWLGACTSIPSLPLIRAVPESPSLWMPIWSAVTIMYRAVLVQAAAIFQFDVPSIARIVLWGHAWGSMAYMVALAWFSCVASQYTIAATVPVPLIAKPFPRLHVVF